MDGSSERNPTLKPGQILAHYRIERLIGQGGMGAVFVAEDTKLHRKVALKVLPAEMAASPDRLARFQLEAQAVAALNHPHIVTVHSVEVAEGIHFLAMELIEGESLDHALPPGGLPLAKVFDVGIALADALGAAHDKGIIHRDLKPANIMVMQDGRVKVLDFGLAKLTFRGGPRGVMPETDLSSMTTRDTSLTKTGVIAGTMPYMSPEQVQGKQVDARSDIFSLGVILYEMAAGRRPHGGGSPAETMSSILRDAPRPLSELRHDAPRHLARIIDHCLRKEPRDRYQAARDIYNELRALRSEIDSALPAPARTQTAGSRIEAAASRLPLSRGAFRVFLIAAATALLAAALLWRYTDREQGSQTAVPRLAILYFENVAEPSDPQRFGEIVTNLLITDLSESRYVTVVSSQRLYDILRKIGKEGVKVIDRDTATAVAREAGADRMLVGSILRAGGAVEVACQLVDVATGASRASQRIRDREDASIFSLVDRLTVEVKRDLELPAEANLERDIDIADVTTHSAEAYRHYLEGLERLNRYQMAEARTSLQKAVAADPMFAMAWIQLTHPWLTSGGGISREEQVEALTRAVEHSTRASRQETHFISATAKAFSNDLPAARAEFEELIRDYPEEKVFYFSLAFLTYDLPTKIKYLERVIAIDPTDRPANNELAYWYQQNGESDKSIQALEQYRRLAPLEPNVYDTAGDLYGLNGDIQESIDAFHKAIELDPTYGNSWFKLGLAYLVTGDKARARDCWNRALTLDPGARAGARHLLAAEPVYRGRLDEALRAYQEARVEDERDGSSTTLFYNRKLFQIGALHAVKRDWRRAEEAFQRARETSRSLNMTTSEILGLSIVHLAPSGSSRLDEDLETLRTMDRPHSRVMYAIASSWVEMARSRHAQAIAAIEGESDFSFKFWVMYTKGMAYLRAGRFKEAVVKLEYCRDVFVIWKNDLPQVAVPLHYHLGEAYEGIGENEKATAEYERFIDFWRDADPILMDEVEGARRRIANLRVQ